MQPWWIMLNICDHRSVYVCYLTVCYRFYIRVYKFIFPHLDSICKTHNPSTFFRLIVLKHTWINSFAEGYDFTVGYVQPSVRQSNAEILSECNYRNLTCEMKNNFCCSVYCGAAEERKRISVMFSLTQMHTDKRGREDRDVPGVGG